MQSNHTNHNPTRLLLPKTLRLKPIRKGIFPIYLYWEPNQRYSSLAPTERTARPPYRGLIKNEDWIDRKEVKDS